MQLGRFARGQDSTEVGRLNTWPRKFQCQETCGIQACLVRRSIVYLKGFLDLKEENVADEHGFSILQNSGTT